MPTTTLNLNSKDFALEVSKGNIDKHSIVQIGGRNPTIGTVFQDVWDAGGKMTYSSSGESWEIVSDSVDDDSTGTGARTVLVKFMVEATKQYITETLIMDGTNPVTFVSSDAYRFRSATVLTWGSTLENQGNITIQVASAGATKGKILRDILVVGDENGLNNSLSGHYTVPSGFTAYPVFLSTDSPKNEDVAFRVQASSNGATSGFLTLGEMHSYQSSFTENLGLAPSGLVEGTDLKFIARSTNTNVIFSMQVFIILIDNTL